MFESDDLLLEKVHKNYKKLARHFNWKLINAEGTKMDVNKKIVDLGTISHQDLILGYIQNSLDNEICWRNNRSDS